MSTINSSQMNTAQLNEGSLKLFLDLFDFLPLSDTLVANDFTEITLDDSLTFSEWLSLKTIKSNRTFGD